MKPLLITLLFSFLTFPSEDDFLRNVEDSEKTEKTEKATEEEKRAIEAIEAMKKKESSTPNNFLRKNESRENQKNGGRSWD